MTQNNMGEYTITNYASIMLLNYSIMKKKKFNYCYSFKIFILKIVFEYSTEVIKYFFYQKILLFYCKG